MSNEIVAVYCDGGVFHKNPSPLGGSWAWCHVDSGGFRVAKGSGMVLPDEVGMRHISNNLTELMALVMSLESLPNGWSGHVYSDSEITLGRAFLGWGCNGIPDWLEARLRHTIALKGKLGYTLLAGHPTREQLRRGYRIKANGTTYPVSRHNVWCDDECGLVYEQFKSSVKLADRVSAAMDEAIQTRAEEQSAAFAQAWGAGEVPTGRIMSGVKDD